MIGRGLELTHEHPHLAGDLAGREVAIDAHLPVRQKAQRIAQPTCVDTQNVTRAASARSPDSAGFSGMHTDSMRLPSARPSRSFVVPSDDCSRRRTAGVWISK